MKRGGVRLPRLVTVGDGHGGLVGVDEGREMKPDESLSPAMVGAGSGGARGRRYLLEGVAVVLHSSHPRPLLRGKP